jgi:hypothetical protein
LEENQEENQISLTDEEKSMILDNIVEFGKFSFDLENDRTKILAKSSHLMAILSILMVLISTYLLKENVFKFVFLSVFGAGLICSLLTAFRYSYTTFENAKDFMNLVDKDVENYKDENSFKYQWVFQLEMAQKSRKRVNDIKANLINSSIILFFISLLPLILNIIIGG